jgi:hypothetical protein
VSGNGIAKLVFTIVSAVAVPASASRSSKATTKARNRFLGRDAPFGHRIEVELPASARARAWLRLPSSKPPSPKIAPRVDSWHRKFFDSDTASSEQHCEPGRALNVTGTNKCGVRQWGAFDVGYLIRPCKLAKSQRTRSGGYLCSPTHRKAQTGKLLTIGR